MLGYLLFFIYMIFGVFISNLIFSEKRPFVRVWLGSVMGTMLLMWTNVPFSFIFGFTIISHVLGILLTLIICGALYYFKVIKSNAILEKKSLFPGQWKVKLDRSEIVLLSLLIPFMILAIVLLLNHTIYEIDGAYYTGQCTYGDMNMHLGFITSIANQGMFPPDYSILPGQQLNYPFLCDSVSSSVYLFGASLRASYILPMAFAFAQVFVGFFYLAKSIVKKTTKAVMAFMFFFLNGGFGIIYFLDNLRADKSVFTQIFDGFYFTPTNLVNGKMTTTAFTNIRWSNVIADMMLPQRATIFGWMALFAILYLLYNAVFMGNKKMWIPAGIMAGLLPMIHTHSFFAVGMVAFAWLIYTVIKNRFSKDILLSWCKFGIPAVLLALPQLLIWTFNAVGGESGQSFIKLAFDWCNTTDNWLWFWVKNVGLVFILMPIAFTHISKEKKFMYSGAILIFVIAEFFVFQPNTYDNNKLFYVWYAFTAIIVADFVVDCYDKLKGIKGRQIIAAVLIIICTNAAVLTLARELYSGFRPVSYQLYSKDMVSAANFIEKNTEPDSTFLCQNNHNNVISSLTGRNIYCGAGTFLFFHGVGYTQRAETLKSFFTNPSYFEANKDDGDIDYVFISSYERSNYSNPNDPNDPFKAYEAYLDSNYSLVYKQGEVKIYDVRG